MKDAFGQKISESDAAITHLYGYTGREYNEVTKLQYNRARYYDPKLGRWINDDPKGFDAGDANLYRYVGNGPTNGTDPSGLDWDPDSVKSKIFLGNREFGEKFAYHVNLSKNNGSEPEYFIDPTHHRYIDVSFPQWWTETEVIDAIFSGDAVFAHNFGGLSLPNEVEHRAAYWGEKTNPMGIGEETWFTAEKYQASQIAALKKGVEKANELIETAVRATRAGEIAYILVRTSKGELFEYGIDEIRNFKNMVVSIPNAIYNHPKESLAAGVFLVITGVDGDVVRQADDGLDAARKAKNAPKRVTKAGEEIRSITVTGWSKGKEAGHFADHAADMGITSQKAYTDAAKALAKKTTDVIEAKVGNTLFKYDKTTQNILIVNGGNRKIKTFYKADNGLQSFKEAMQAHWEVLKNQGHKP